MATPVQKDVLFNNLSVLKDKCNQNVGGAGVSQAYSQLYANFSYKIGQSMIAISNRSADTLDSAKVNALNQAIKNACDELDNGVDYEDIHVLNYVDSLLQTL